MDLDANQKSFLTRWLKGLWRATVRFLKREKILHPEALPSDAPSAPEPARCAQVPELPAATSTADVPDTLPAAHIIQPLPPPEPEQEPKRLNSIAPDGSPIVRKL